MKKNKTDQRQLKKLNKRIKSFTDNCLKEVLQKHFNLQPVKETAQRITRIIDPVNSDYVSYFLDYKTDMQAFVLQTIITQKRNAFGSVEAPTIEVNAPIDLATKF